MVKGTAMPFDDQEHRVTPSLTSTEQDRLIPPSELSEIAEQAKIIDGQIVGDIETAKALQTSEADSSEVTDATDAMQTLREAVIQEQAGLEVKLERLSQPYVVSEELGKALKTARLLGKPLLIEGEPGTGKTSLAYALAGHEDLPIIHTQCKSTSTAEDLLYQFDVVKRLQDAQLGKDVSELRQYVQLGPLGRALASDEQMILLIDEVDKARREFTNDLLHELDKSSFFINETGEEVSAKNKPIVIITSNHERELPEPVLRRVVYSYVEFPDQEQLSEIVNAHMPDVSDTLLNSAIDRFYEIRNTEGIQKKPSTSEILDWLKVLRAIGIDDLDSKQALPALEAIIKHKKDLDLLKSTSEQDTVAKAELTETDDQETLEAVMRGDKVLVVNDSHGGNTKKLGAIFANNGIDFDIANLSDSDDEYYARYFPVLNHYGVYFTDRNTLAISKELPEYDVLVQQLTQAGLVESELRQIDKATFSEVISSKNGVMKGKDSEGHVLFKTQDGRYYAYKDSASHDEEQLADWERELLDATDKHED